MESQEIVLCCIITSTAYFAHISGDHHPFHWGVYRFVSLSPSFTTSPLPYPQSPTPTLRTPPLISSVTCGTDLFLLYQNRWEGKGLDTEVVNPVSRSSSIVLLRTPQHHLPEFRPLLPSLSLVPSVHSWLSGTHSALMVSTHSHPLRAGNHIFSPSLAPLTWISLNLWLSNQE